MPETRNQRVSRQAKIADLLDKTRGDLKDAAKADNFMLDHAINILRSPNATDEAQIRMLDKATQFLKKHRREEYEAAYKPTRSELYHKAEKERINDGVDSAVKLGKSALGLGGTLLKGGTALVSHTLGFAGTAASLSGKGLAGLGMITYHGFNTIGAFGGLGRIARATIAGGAALGAVGYMAIPIEANEHASLLGHTMAQAQMHQACLNPLVIKADPVSAAFSVAHGDHNAGVDMIRRASERALLYGVAPEALFYLAAYETDSFRDLVANNSSATNPWQVILPTKFAYMRAYGQETFFYKDAVERLENGTSTDQDADLKIRDSVDAIVAAKQSEIDTAIKDNKFPPLLFAAKVLADDVFFAAEMVSLDVYKNAPELRLENLDGVSAEERLERTAAYYAPEHLLGATNTRHVKKLINAVPDVRLTNTEATDDIIGNDKANALKRVVLNNPGAIPENVTAATLIPSIIDSFERKVAPYSTPVVEVSYTGTSAFDLCVTNKEELGIDKGPIMASRAEIYYTMAMNAIPLDALNGVFNTVQSGVSVVADTFRTAETTKTPAPNKTSNASIEGIILGLN